MHRDVAGVRVARLTVGDHREPVLKLRRIDELTPRHRDVVRADADVA